MSSEPTDAAGTSLSQRIEDLHAEVRRQGRAAVAAQAAAESCLEAIETLREGLEGHERAANDASSPDAGDAERMVLALLPVADALERVALVAAASARDVKTPSWWARLGGARDEQPRFAAIAEGLRLLRAQLDDALASAGVEIDRRAGVAVDGDAHRVVETRADATSAPGTVIEVVRAGYSIGAKRLREADVVVTPAALAPPREGDRTEEA